MQPSTSSPRAPADVADAPLKQRRRRRRRNQKNKQKSPADPTDVATDASLDLKDLTRDAFALEKQLQELQAQLKINYANIPKDQGRRANAIALEQVHATEEEMSFVRTSLEHIYQQALTKDPLYAASQHMDDKLWRFIFYPRVEELRHRLRKTPDTDTHHATLLKNYHHHLDHCFKFYRELNHTIKAIFHLDTRTMGIDLFRHPSNKKEEDRIAKLLQANYVCMGDLARYRASAAHAPSSANDWAVSKLCYQKAVDVFRANGKPYSQLALVAASTGSVIDVVCYYCMSMATKYPSSVGRDNLQSFYSKIRFAGTGSPQPAWKPSQHVAHYVDAFLQMHQAVLFQQSDNYPPFSNGLCIAMAHAMQVQDQRQDALFQILRSTLTRSITILIISIWHMDVRARDKPMLRRAEFKHMQMRLLEFGFHLLTKVGTATVKDADDPKVAMMANNTLLPALSLWCTFIFCNMDIIAQFCHGAEGHAGMIRDEMKRSLIREIQSFCSFVINHPLFPVPAHPVLPSQYPLSEDNLLLGVIPLIPFHKHVDFFKEIAHDVADPSSMLARQQVRWGRVRDLIRRMADSNSFQFVQFNATDQNFVVMDENAKRQQQSRFMKALATQRLMDQVSALEKDVDELTLVAPVRHVYTVVVDVTAFLDDLPKVKKWANLVLDTRQRDQSAIVQVIVPLNAIDVLDQFKKGTDKANVHARESIRYLDQQLLRQAHETTAAAATAPPLPTHSFLRTQKMAETLDGWDQVAAFWIGETSRRSTQLMSDDDDNDKNERNGRIHTPDTVDYDNDTDNDDENDDSDASASDDDLFRRRYADDDSDDDDFASTTDEDDSHDDDEHENDELSDPSENAASAEEEDIVDWQDVPKKHRAVLNCFLYQFKQQQQPLDPKTDQPEHHVTLVTNDEQLAWWAELFGDPASGQRVQVHSVKEYDRLLGAMIYTKPSSKRQRHRQRRTS